MSEREPLQPNGMEVEITTNHQVIVEFDHEDIPPIHLTQHGAKNVARNLHSAADRAKNHWDGDDE
jgi:hypothetical protein